MAAALVAGRVRLRTVVLNTETPRNAVSAASHGLLTRDGAHASELLAVAKEQLSKYPSVEYRKQRALAVQRQPEHFEVETEAGTLRTRRLILATGFADRIEGLEIPGLEAVYGRTVFPCPFCDGFEHADERWAAFMGDGVEHYAQVLRMWTADLIVFTNGRTLSGEARAALAANDIPLVESRIEALEAEGDHLRAVRTVDGEVYERDAGFIGDEFAEPATPFADQLGVPRKDNPFGRVMYETQDGGKTQIERLYLVGDAHRQFGGLSAASYDGATCIQHIVHELSQERWKTPN